MTPGAVLDRLTAFGARVVLTPAGTLRYHGPARVLPEDGQQELAALKAELPTHKAALVALLTPPIPRDPPDALPPCAVCGDADRWDDAGVWRCVTCETLPVSDRLRQLARRDGDPGPPAW